MENLRMPHKEEFVTSLLTLLGVTTGTIGMWATNFDLTLAILLKLVSITATVLVIAINWEKGTTQIKKGFNKLIKRWKK